MLSLKDFKGYEVKKEGGLNKINGGIMCDDVPAVLSHLQQNNPAQYLAVLNGPPISCQGYDYQGNLGWYCYHHQ
jgi:hypothetical protein